MTKYVSVDFVTALNTRYCLDSSGIRDADGAAGAVGRPQATWDGVDKFPTIWLKAAVLLHGIATTQNWANGNKRTAYLATQAFLRINKSPLRELAVIDRLAFIAAVAQKVMTVEQVAEWLESNRLRSADRLGYAVLATAAEQNSIDGGSWSGEDISISGFHVSRPLVTPTLYLVQRVHWTLHDLPGPHRLHVSLHTVDGGQGKALVFNGGDTELVSSEIPVVRTGHPNHKHGIMSGLLVATLNFIVLRAGDVKVVTHFKGDMLSSLPLQVGMSPPEAPETLEGLQAFWKSQ